MPIDPHVAAVAAGPGPLSESSSSSRGLGSPLSGRFLPLWVGFLHLEERGPLERLFLLSPRTAAGTMAFTVAAVAPAGPLGPPFRWK